MMTQGAAAIWDIPPNFVSNSDHEKFSMLITYVSVAQSF